MANGEEREDRILAEQICVSLSRKGPEGEAGMPFGAALLTFARRESQIKRPKTMHWGEFAWSAEAEGALREAEAELGAMALRFLDLADGIGDAGLAKDLAKESDGMQTEALEGSREEGRVLGFSLSCLLPGEGLGGIGSALEAKRCGERLERLSLALERFAESEGLAGALVSSVGWGVANGMGRAGTRWRASEEEASMAIAGLRTAEAREREAKRIEAASRATGRAKMGRAL